MSVSFLTHLIDGGIGIGIGIKDVCLCGRKRKTKEEEVECRPLWQPNCEKLNLRARDFNP